MRDALLVLVEEFCNVIGCVVHAFIYAEPKQINGNLYDFWLKKRLKKVAFGTR